MYKRIFDKNDQDILKFRKLVISECQGDPNDADIEYSYTELIKKYSKNSKAEDIFRYTKKKWLSTNFDHIDTYWINNEISCISGAILYKNWIKGAVYHYNLKKYSITNRTLLFKDDGMLDRLVNYAMSKNLDGIFISIYPHNNKLKSLVTRLKEGKSIPTTGNLQKIRSLSYSGSYIYNNVTQEFFSLPLKCVNFSKDILYNR